MTPPISPWLRWAWRAWLVYALLLAALVLLSLPRLYAALAQPCDPTAGYCVGSALTPSQFADLQASGFPVPLHTILKLAFVFIVDSALGFTLALVLYRRQPGNWAALALALPIVSHAAAYPGGLLLLEAAYPWLRPLTRLPDFFVLIGWFAAFLIFPDGRFVPRWGRWLLLAALPAALVAFLYNQADFDSPWATVVSAGFALSFVLILVFQVYRYRFVSGPIQRAQARWVIYCLAILFSYILLQPLLNKLVPALTNPDSFFAHDLNEIFGTLFGPVMAFLGLWLAIVRARLWDIDLIIRRTLVYSVLSALLALVYFGSVVVLESGLRGLTGGGGSQAAIVLSTLLIAALFGPLRGRVQALIDRRFYRRKYDAARTLAAFGVNMRDNVDLDALGDRLTAVVDDTMQPAHISLWAPADAPRPKQL